MKYLLIFTIGLCFFMGGYWFAKAKQLVRFHVLVQIMNERFATWPQDRLAEKFGYYIAAEDVNAALNNDSLWKLVKLSDEQQRRI